MKKSFSRAIVYPIFYRQKQFRNKGSHNWLSLFKTMLQRERWNAGELQAYQFDRLKNLLIHAGQNVPYYQDLFKSHGFDPYRFQDVRELSILPRLTKDIISNQGQRLVSKDAGQRGVFRNRTSGSTGSPLVFYQDQNYRDHQRVAAWMSDAAAGWRMGDRVIRLWGATDDIKNNLKTSTKKFVNWLLNQHFYPSHQLTEETMLRYHDEMSRHNPDILVAYASSAYLMALFLESRKLKANYPAKAMITSAEVLHDYMRQTIERVFKSKVYDRYASRDAGLIGYECEKHNGLHVNMQNLFLECASTRTIDEPSFACITLLENYSMPLIRYEIGDLLVMSDKTCTCGRSAPLIERVVGRSQDFLTLRSGKKFVGEFITSKFLYTDGIKNFQFVQETLEDFVLYIVKGDEFDETALEKIQIKIRSALGEDCKINTIFVEDIPPTAAGKFRTVISKVPLRFDE